MKRSTASDPLWSPPPVERTEWLLVGLLVLTGTVLRCWQPSHMAVEHFDEGVYASNLFCRPENAYPFRHLYAPPLLPALLEWALILSGGTAGSVMLVNLVAGCVMVPSVWWVGRAWFGPIAGVTAAALAAFSEVHILYSRTALTDVLLCLWLLWGVYWAWRAINEGTPAAILLAGVFASLAWWTKYNGWLTLAISGSGTLAWIIVPRLLTKLRLAAHFKCAAKRPLSPLLRWLVFATLAVVGWLPYLIELQNEGGYAVVAANHAGYFVGLAGWWDGLLRQAANLNGIETWWTFVGLLVAFVVTVTLLRLRGHLPNEPGMSTRDVWRTILSINAIAVAGLVIAIFGGLTGVMGAVASVGLALSILRPTVSCETRLAVWMLAAWLVGLFVAVPLYHPYPRLTLPFVVACWLGCGLTFSRLRPEAIGLTPIPDRKREFATSRQLVGVGLALIGFSIVLLMFRSPLRITPPAWEDRRGLQHIAEEILLRLPSDGEQVVSVVGDPGLFFQLAAHNHSPQRIIVPWSNLGDISPADPALVKVGVYAVVGTHSQGSPTTKPTLIGEWPYQPSRFVLLNKYAPATIQAGETKPQTIQLLRFDAQ